MHFTCTKSFSLDSTVVEIQEYSARIEALYLLQRIIMEKHFDESLLDIQDNP